MIVSIFLLELNPPSPRDLWIYSLFTTSKAAGKSHDIRSNGIPRKRGPRIRDSGKMHLSLVHGLGTLVLYPGSR